MPNTSESPEQDNNTKNDNTKNNNRISRKDFLKLLGAGATVLAFGRFAGLLAPQSNAQLFTLPLPFNSGLVTTQPITPLERIGRWDIFSPIEENAIPEQATKCPVLPIHAALLRTGKVLFLSGSQNDPTFFSCKKFRNVLWDPSQPASPSSFKVFDTPSGEPHTDVFCCGQSFLSDGRLIISGGTEEFKADGLSPVWDGAKQTYFFDPQTETFQYVPNNDMHLGRWYPSVITLSNGRVLSISGFEIEPNISQPEIYIGPKQGWTQPLSYSASASEIIDMENRMRGCADLPNMIEQDFIKNNGPPWPLYPHIFLLQDGRLFYSGGYVFANHWCFPPGWLELNQIQNSFRFTPLPTNLPPDFFLNRRDQSSTVMLPPAQDQKIMIIGGGNQGAGDMHNRNPPPPIINQSAINNVHIIDLSFSNGGSPKYEATGPLHLARIHLNAVLLPDRTVLVSGGNFIGEGRILKDGTRVTTTAVRVSEIYNPASKTWTIMNTSKVDRLYHSLAVLLPDGRVVAAGSNPDQAPLAIVCPDKPSANSFRENKSGVILDIYSPPYLFRGSRPVIDKVDEELVYGGNLDIYTSQAITIPWAHILRPMATTHSYDSEQRLVDLQITSASQNVLTTRVTNNPNIAPPGWYMLFIANQISNESIPRAIPSVAKWVHLSGTRFERKWGSKGAANGEFNLPLGIAVQSAIDFVFVYVSDLANARIQKFVRDGTFISSIGPFVTSVDGTITEGMTNPMGIAFDSRQNLYICDAAHHRILKLDSNGRLVTQWGSFGSDDEQFNTPWGIGIDSSDNVYVTNNDPTIRVFDSNGTFLKRWGSFGDSDGQFSTPRGIAIDKSISPDTIYVTDIVNQNIQVFSKDTTSFLAKFGCLGKTANGQFDEPRGIAVDSKGIKGKIYVADTFNHRIQIFKKEEILRNNPANNECTSNNAFVRKWGSFGSGDGQFNFPEGIAVDSVGNVYVADTGNNRIQVFSTVIADE